MAASSYCPAPDVLAWDCPPCRATNLSAAVAPRIFTEVLTGASGFVGAFGAGGDTLVLSFRGSENLQNWVENLKIAKTDRNMSCAGCKVHSRVRVRVRARARVNPNPNPNPSPSPNFVS